MSPISLTNTDVPQKSGIVRPRKQAVNIFRNDIRMGARNTAPIAKPRLSEKALPSTKASPITADHGPVDSDLAKLKAATAANTAAKQKATIIEQMPARFHAKRKAVDKVVKTKLAPQNKLQASESAEVTKERKAAPRKRSAVLKTSKKVMSAGLKKLLRGERKASKARYYNPANAYKRKREDEEQNSRKAARKEPLRVVGYRVQFSLKL
ncbi:hypothetical protein N0V90_008443 [Kalmusia sp. IMI 367209]|nr:hypothetical protein N0V90_008443 [Kalmusia sp. IMI 367209]